MIDLTPLEVRKKKGDFRRGIRGYDPPQVDEFLDLVADRLEEVVRENLALRDRVGRLEQQVTDNRDREKALTEALVTAQEMREEVRSQVAREADLARRQAEQDVEKIRARADQVREREEDMLKRLRKRQLQFVQTYRAFLEREMSDLASIMEALEMNEGLGDVAHGAGPAWPTEAGGGVSPAVAHRSGPGREEGRARRARPLGGSAATPQSGPPPPAPAKESPAPESTKRPTAAESTKRPPAPESTEGPPAPASAKGPPTPSRASGDSATAARAPESEPAVDAEEEETASWVDDLLSQPALQPVRPPPLAATRGGEPPERRRPVPAAREEPAASADLVLSDNDVLDGEEESQASSAGRAATGLGDGSNDDLADEIDALLSEVGDDEAEAGVATTAGNDADSKADDEAALAAEMADVPTWTVEPVGGRAAASPDEQKTEAAQKRAKDEAAKAAPNQQQDANLGLSLVPEPKEFQDFGDFSELKGSADYGLLPEVESADADDDLSSLTLRPNSGQQAKPPDAADEGGGSDDDPEDLLSAVFGDGR